MNRARESGFLSTDDTVSKAKRIMALIDEYHDCPTNDNRYAIRSALIDVLASPAAQAQEPNRDMNCSTYDSKAMCATCGQSWAHHYGNVCDEYDDSRTFRLAAAPARRSIADILAERKRQDAQWGGPAHDDSHNIWDWLHFIDLQVGKTREGPIDQRARLVKIAALALAAIESIDRKDTEEICPHGIHIDNACGGAAHAPLRAGLRPLMSTTSTPKPAAAEAPAVPTGWRVQRNSDGSIGIFGPPPREGESRRTSHAIYPNDRSDLGELMFKFFTHVLAVQPKSVDSHEPQNLRDKPRSASSVSDKADSTEPLSIDRISEIWTQTEFDDATEETFEKAVALVRLIEAAHGINEKEK